MVAFFVDQMMALGDLVVSYMYQGHLFSQKDTYDPIPHSLFVPHLKMKRPKRMSRISTGITGKVGRGGVTSPILWANLRAVLNISLGLFPGLVSLK